MNEIDTAKISGTKHLIECHCILPQYRGKKNTVFHKFVVFSMIDASDTCVPKFVQCNNCNAVHKVYDICKSEILPGRDELRSVVTKKEVKLGINRDVREILETYDCDISTWEMAKFVLDYEKWGTSIVLTQDNMDENTQGKALIFESRNVFKLENFTRTNII
tara:strand:- start:20 stop:505 length:486 start_codon:yes stop_codon:yes gene_type:complete